MYLFIIIALKILIVDSQEEQYGYCDAKSDTCITNDKKFLFYDVNPPEGFNLRRDVYMRYAIMLKQAHERGKRKEWSLILPPFYNLYHWKFTDKKPFPWNSFFDLDSLKSFVPVFELYEVFDFEKLSMPKLSIDSLYVLQNFEERCENNIFEDKWQINNECNYDGQYWGYNNITVKNTVCVRFQGAISKLWEIISLRPNDKKVIIAHGEIPLHDKYGSKTYWECRKSIKFNRKLVEVALDYIKTKFDCDTTQCTSYVSVHWRRQDFAYSRVNDIPSIKGTAKQIDDTIKKFTPNINKVFIATDAKSSEIDELESQLKSLGHKAYFYMPSTRDMQYGDGGLAIIEQIICSRAEYFIATHESTFSFRIQEEREILGFDHDTTFNRLCPDKGMCEKPSRWYIIN